MRDEGLRRRIGRVRRGGRREGGFTLIEFLIAVAILAPVLGASVILATQLQRVYGSRLDDATVEEEVRFSIDWIAQALRNAGSNPYAIGGFEPIDVNEDGTSITVRADVNPPDGLTTGANEDLTIAFDADEMAITRDDNSVVADPEQMTEPVIAGLLFTLFDANGDQLDDGEEIHGLRACAGDGPVTDLQPDARRLSGNDARNRSARPHAMTPARRRLARRQMMGNVSSMLAPPVGERPAVARPSCRTAIFCTTASPSPVPPTRFV